MDDTIAQMVRQRRRALHGSDAGGQPWGLALSGGGIRSATFCLGLLKALAQRGQLLRFDLLSTVSGGGYVGATLGRLCDRARSPDQVREVEATLADLDRTRMGVWLRGNGRYLIPGGLSDTLFAVALYLRNLLGTHIELAIAATLLGLALGGVDLLVWSAAASAVDLSDGVVPPLVRWLTRVPTVWVLLAALAPAAVLLANAYWAVRDGPYRWREPVFTFLLWGLFAAAALFFAPVLRERYALPGWLLPAAVGLALSWMLVSLWRLCVPSSRQAPAQLRNTLTLWLSVLLRVALVIALLGLVDVAAWWLAQSSQRSTRLGFGGVLVVAAAGLRAALPLLSSGRRELPSLGKGLLLSLASLLGMAVAFCLVAWWISVLYAALLLPVFTAQGLDFGRGGVWWLLMALVVGGYALATGRNIGFLNLSSLHMFYKARIVRAYLGAANEDRLGARPGRAVVPAAMPQVAVGRVQASDDVDQGLYGPHRHGGPVHLVNMCVNQTLDPGNKAFNRDRKGLLMTVAPEGWVRANGQPWTKAQAVPDRLTLGGWVSISGAALAPGLGRLTQRGVAALTLFAGLRLGYWWDAQSALAPAPRRWWQIGDPLAKTVFVLRECFGVFAGTAAPHWYLSDGGHFENTGAYALLQQESRLIVLADCGADPDYGFCDLENLVRCARIDLGANISFLKPRSGAFAAATRAFGSLNDLSSMNSQACLALARVRYSTPGKEGFILLVKPNVSADLPVDLMNFKAGHPVFPQEPTTDQFFSEAQWESYFRLGNAIAARIDGALLDDIASGALLESFEADDGLSGRRSPAAEGAPSGTWSRIQDRVKRHDVVKTSLGIGTVATLAVAMWQAASGYGAQTDAQRKEEDVVFKSLAEGWGQLRAGETGGAAPRLAGELVHAADTLCTDAQGGNFIRRFALSGRIIADARVACDEGADREAPACTELRRRGEQAGCLDARRAEQSCVPRYWARDYAGRGASQDNCVVVRSMPWQPALVLADYLWDHVGPDAGYRTAAAPPMPAPSAAGAALPPPSAVPAPATAPAPPPAADPARPQAEPARPAADGPQAAPPPPAASACAGAKVYIQIYGPTDRVAARALREPWRALGASVPPIEDVLATARNAGRAPPIGYTQPTLIYHTPALLACVQALAATQPGAAWTLRPLPKGLRVAPDTVEAWLPRAADR